jgi:MFS transporter, FHS family, glucose/mannose:H+ symporter
MYNRKLVFFAACIGMLLFGISLITLGSIIPDLREKIGIDEAGSGTLFAILPFGILAGSLIFGPVCDRSGYKPLLFSSTVFIGCGFLALADVTSLFLLKIIIFLFGAGAGAINGATNAMVSDLSTKEKGANLSLLGVCFAVGALGMPLVLGLLKNIFSFEVILIAVAILTAATGVFYLIIKFPPPKHAESIPAKEGLNLLRDGMLILISFFLFFQSSFESLINNWTTTYLISEYSAEQNKALFALSLNVMGMAVMRIMIGSIFRKIKPEKILLWSWGLILVALVILKTGTGLNTAASGLFLLGAGLAGGFPIMLGFVGDRFIKLSGTAFSLAFGIALCGNMLINYLMGLIARKYGIHHLISITFVEFFALIILGLIVFKRRKATISPENK